MPNEVKVFKKLQFLGGAKRAGNIEGPMQVKDVILYDDFLGPAIDTTNDWATSVPGTGDTIAINAAVGGHVRLTTGSVLNDSCMLASEICWEADKKALCEARIRINDFDQTALFFGFSDAKSEANNSIAIHYASDTLTTVADNATGFVFDPSSTTLGTTSILCCGVKANADATTVDSGKEWDADEEWHVLRVEMDVDGYANFYIDGESVGRVTNAVTDSTDLCVTVQAMTREAAANTVDVDYIFAWEER